MNRDQIRSRRDFLGRVLAAWASLTSVPFLYVVARFVYPPIGDHTLQEEVIAAQADDIPASTAKIVRFNKKPVIVIHTPEGQFKAFSANCTHLGCVVEYRGGEGLFYCNCHGSMFNLDGKNLRGPALTPLGAVKVSLKGPDVILSAPEEKG